MVADIKERLSPDGELFKSIKRRSAAPAAASSGLSAADIERIAKAVQVSAPASPASAPAASFPASPAPRFTAAERPDDLAIIVGIESYSDIASKASYAERDADAFKAYVRALGVPERNIVLLKGSKAGKASFVKNLESWLPRMVKPDSRVYFYFSGHGAPDVKTGQAYLVPWDGDPNFLEDTAYPVAKLYKRLGELPAKQVLVAMDSCFSGAGGRSVLASGARPLVGRIDTGAVPAKITVLAASGANEISGSLDDKGHGAFTYFLLEGLNAGKTTPKALNEYLTPRVQDEARRLNRDQTPQLQGGGDWSLR
ncbi:MAG: caspase family protein [Elusimicrobia bacterium]|nr:caspase family protein [Elusimicrobiota bacterium]